MSIRFFCIIVLVGIAYETSARASTIDDAVRAYNKDDYVQAASLFGEVAEYSKQEDERVRAEYYLAHSLYKLGLIFSAYTFYRDVFEQGEKHEYYIRAAEGLLNVATILKDDILVPETINRGYSEAFRGLTAERLNTVNYMVGFTTERQGNSVEARDFFLAVNSDADEYPKALYRLAVMEAELAKNENLLDKSVALKYFNQIEKRLKGTISSQDKKLYRLALLGQARVYYSMGKYQESLQYYKKVPRFSDDWYDAMFESGWAYRMNALNQSSDDAYEANIGLALGMMHSVQSPYFKNIFRPESYILKATAYFDLCYFRRARAVLDTFSLKYEPMVSALESLSQSELSDPDLIELVTLGQANFPEEVQQKIRSNPRFKRYIDQLKRMRSEQSRIEQSFESGPLKTQLLDLLAEQETNWIGLIARLVRLQLERVQVFLKDFVNQAKTIQFEITDAERRLLESGEGEIRGQKIHRERIEPESEENEYWSFNDEYWLDELGYYRYSIKRVCPSSVFD